MRTTVSGGSQGEVDMSAESVGYQGTVLWAVNVLVESTVNEWAPRAAVRVHLHNTE